jgi:hypothetical protein
MTDLKNKGRPRYGVLPRWPWHSAVEFKRYLRRFMTEFTRIETLAGVKRTIFNQYGCARPAARELARQTGSALLEGFHRHESGSDGRGR